ncbi:MAG: pseudouridine synthase [Desulfobacterales bacterium]
MALIRLQKFLSVAGVCSRRKGEEHIRSGKVRVNGEVVTELGTKVDPEIDRIQFDGKLVQVAQKRVYIALNKPRGFVTSCNQKQEKIVLDLIDLKERIYPVGRLDKDSTGLLLLTNDGAVHQKLSHPSYDHEKEYDVTVAMPIQDRELRRMSDGLTILGSKTRPAVITRMSARRFRIVLQEGRNRQIRRMVEKVGNRVTNLKRIRISNIKLDALKEGDWRYLTEKEKKSLTLMSS